jgi:hypothetical protein
VTIGAELDRVQHARLMHRALELERAGSTLELETPRVSRRGSADCGRSARGSRRERRGRGAAQSAALGDPIAPGSVRRDPNPTFCVPPDRDTWNATNGVKVVW